MGIWNLLAHDVMFNNTSVLQPSGSNPLGKLVITPGGYFSVLITDSEIAIPLPNKTLWTKGSDADVARIAKSVVSYCGQYSPPMSGSNSSWLPMSRLHWIRLDEDHAETKCHVYCRERSGVHVFKFQRPYLYNTAGEFSKSCIFPCASGGG